MELSQEAHHLIVRYVGTRKDLLTLCTVSKRFQKEAERALYDTLHLRGHERTLNMCQLLASTPRLSTLVDALSICVVGDETEGSDDEQDPPVPEEYWDAVAAALGRTTKLRFLNICFEQGGDTEQAWVFDNCTFQLQTLHCDLAWDDHLSTFLDTQTELSDLYLADFRTSSEPTPSTESLVIPKLSVLECTFIDAAAALVPGRPVVRVKTCFSRSRVEDKRTELRELFSKLRLSRKPLRALDIGDESYTPQFSLELLNMATRSFPNSTHLRYLGTLVLPVDSKQVSLVVYSVASFRVSTLFLALSVCSFTPIS